MNVDFEDVVVHLFGFGETDGSSLKPFEMSSKIEVFTLDILGAFFADVMSFLVQIFGIALPMVGVKVLYLTRRELLDQLFARGIGASA